MRQAYAEGDSQGFKSLKSGAVPVLDSKTVKLSPPRQTEYQIEEY